jgi:hypothetical protein
MRFYRSRDPSNGMRDARIQYDRSARWVFVITTEPTGMRSRFWMPMAFALAITALQLQVFETIWRTDATAAAAVAERPNCGPVGKLRQ